MFGKSKKELKERIAELEMSLLSEVHRNKQLNKLNENLLKKFNETPRLVSIEVIKHQNVFKFIRGNKTFTIETINVLQDNIPQWRKDANLEVENNG